MRVYSEYVGEAVKLNDARFLPGPWRQQQVQRHLNKHMHDLQGVTLTSQTQPIRNANQQGIICQRP
jgi:hypothetical protein